MKSNIEYGVCGCGAKSPINDEFGTLGNCKECKKPLCVDCRHCSDLDGSGDYCAPCFWRLDL
jgi:hypothetical protein